MGVGKFDHRFLNLSIPKPELESPFLGDWFLSGRCCLIGSVLSPPGTSLALFLSKKGSFPKLWLIFWFEAFQNSRHFSGTHCP
ncbi:MAG TPA: hypothetical protein DDW50_16580 [Firmicutes bacterium]|nr:hypothetical protein [Bacillota bacterium]